MLSSGARRLYRQLLDLGPVEVKEAPVDAAEDVRLVALLDLGLVYENDERYYAVAPPAARSRVLVEAGRRSQELLARGLDAESFLASFVTPGQQAAGGVPDAVEVVSGVEARLLSNTMLRDARREVRSVNTAVAHAGDARFYRTGPTEDDVDAGIVYRVIYARATVERGVGDPLGIVHFPGEQARTHPDPILKLKMVDDNAVLVPLDETGDAGALLIRARPLCRLFADYFERLWAEAAPIGTDGARSVSGEVSALQVRILGLIADDAGDVDICRRLGISDRTLRRHVGTVLQRLGVQNRAAAVAAGIRRGWLS